MKKHQFKKMRRSLGTSGTNFKCYSIRIIGVPEGEEEAQQNENLSGKTMKENFPNLAKEIDI